MQLAPEFRSQAVTKVGISLPGPAQVGEQRQSAKGDRENDEPLQKEFQHGEKPCFNSLEGWTTRHAGPVDRGAAHACQPVVATMPDPLPTLSTTELETLMAALDPLLDGFGEGGSCLDDASAYLARLGIQAEGDTAATGARMLQWIESWRAAGGNRQTLRLMVSTLLAQGSEAQSPSGVDDTANRGASPEQR